MIQGKRANPRESRGHAIAGCASISPLDPERNWLPDPSVHPVQRLCSVQDRDSDVGSNGVTSQAARHHQLLPTNGNDGLRGLQSKARDTIFTIAVSLDQQQQQQQHPESRDDRRHHGLDGQRLTLTASPVDPTE